MVFISKHDNDPLTRRNGEKVDVLYRRGAYCDVRFKDGTIVTVYRSEIRKEQIA